MRRLVGLVAMLIVVGGSASQAGADPVAATHDGEPIEASALQQDGLFGGADYGLDAPVDAYTLMGSGPSASDLVVNQGQVLISNATEFAWTASVGINRLTEGLIGWAWERPLHDTMTDPVNEVGDGVTGDLVTPLGLVGLGFGATGLVALASFAIRGRPLRDGLTEIGLAALLVGISAGSLSQAGTIFEASTNATAQFAGAAISAPGEDPAAAGRRLQAQHADIWISRAWQEANFGHQLQGDCLEAARLGLAGFYPAERGIAGRFVGTTRGLFTKATGGAVKTLVGVGVPIAPGGVTDWAARQAASRTRGGNKEDPITEQLKEAGCADDIAAAKAKTGIRRLFTVLMIFVGSAVTMLTIGALLLVVILSDLSFGILSIVAQVAVAGFAWPGAARAGAFRVVSSFFKLGAVTVASAWLVGVLLRVQFALMNAPALPLVMKMALLPLVPLAIFLRRKRIMGAITAPVGRIVGRAATAAPSVSPAAMGAIAGAGVVGLGLMSARSGYSVSHAAASTARTARQQATRAVGHADRGRSVVGGVARGANGVLTGVGGAIDGTTGAAARVAMAGRVAAGRHLRPVLERAAVAASGGTAAALVTAGRVASAARNRPQPLGPVYREAPQWAGRPLQPGSGEAGEWARQTSARLVGVHHRTGRALRAEDLDPMIPPRRRDTILGMSAGQFPVEGALSRLQAERRIRLRDADETETAWIGRAAHTDPATRAGLLDYQRAGRMEVRHGDLWHPLPAYGDPGVFLAPDPTKVAAGGTLATFDDTATWIPDHPDPNSGLGPRRYRAWKDRDNFQAAGELGRSTDFGWDAPTTPEDVPDVEIFPQGKRPRFVEREIREDYQDVDYIDEGGESVTDRG